MNVPYEVLVHLFKFIPHSDRLAASEACKSWYLAANDKCFMKNKQVTFIKSQLCNSESPLKIFENSILEYVNYKFYEVEISSDVYSFWDNIGPSIKQLTLTNCDIAEKVFVHIIKKCLNLEVLKIENCRELFMSGCLLEGKTDGLLTEKLEGLKTLSLSGNQYLSDALFNRFVSVTPHLENLNLSSCSLQFHRGLVKKFYPSCIELTTNPSESVLTFYYILQFITCRAKHIKHLSFSKTLIDGSALKALSGVQELELETLNVNCCDQLTNIGILALCTHQTSLTVLDVGLCTRVTDQSLLYICTYLVNLEQLSIQRCRAVTDLGIAELQKLKNLKSINIAQCELVTRDGLEKGICSEQSKTLFDLDIHCLNIDQETLIMLSERLPLLQSLDVSYCFNAVTDASIQVILKNQTVLHTLKMSHCDKLSDAGLTGMNKVQETAEVQKPSSSTSSIDYGTTSHPRIYLGSKAEEEIVIDARRKQDVMKLCENITIDNFSGYSLTNLKGLKFLDISGCNRITDVSLKYAFSFIELKDLNLSKCQQVTHEGVELLVKNCPSIENLNLIDCYNLDDRAITMITQHLARLKRLELRGCIQLTDKTADAVRFNCRKLQYLDLIGCRNIDADFASTIGDLPNVHTILMSRPGPYSNEGTIKAPTATLFPTLMRKFRFN